MKRFFLILISSILLSACVKDAPIDRNDEETVNFAVDFGKKSVTRGTPITNASQLTTMGVFCAYTAINDWTTAATFNKMFNVQLNNNSGSWSYQNSDVYWGSADLADRYTFFGYAPFANSSNGLTVNGSASSNDKPQLQYSVPVNVVDQPDLMVSVPRYNVRPTGSPVQLQMKHALTCVGFQVAGNGEKVTGISISGIASSGSMDMDGGNIVWNIGAVTTTDFSASLNYDAGQSYYTTTANMSANLIAGDGYLMMIPQTLGNNAKATITLDDNTTRTVALDNQVWTAGKKVTYLVTILKSGTITVSPQTLVLPCTGTTAATNNITVTCLDNTGNQDPTMAWTLTSADSWFTLSLNSAAISGTATVSGTGSAMVYTIAGKNDSTTAERNTTVYLGGIPSDVVVNVRQLKVIDTSSGGGTVISNESYVGAFWKKTQKGERIINIETKAANAGDWCAYVEYMDGRWNEGDIVLSTDLLDDVTLQQRGITWNIATENPQNAELTPVTGDATVVSGTTVAGESIAFRIGLKTTYATTTTYPVRYATIVVMYRNNSVWQKIFLRQGEDPDCVIDKTGLNMQEAAYIRRFSPYNLTAPNNVLAGSDKYYQVAVNGGVFTDYPSQAGAFFQWAKMATYSSYRRIAYHPIDPTGALTGWDGTNGSGGTAYWNTMGDTNESCPTGYARPQNGSYTSSSAGAVTSSQVAYTLFTDPSSGTTVYDSSKLNALVGFYADGFFDRRDHNSPSIAGSSNTNCAVSWQTIGNNNSANVAYAGWVLYNPKQTIGTDKVQHYNASIFFPMAGGRNDTTGALESAGDYGRYMTASCNTGQTYWSLSFAYTKSFFMKSDLVRNYGTTIRCIKTEV